MRMQFEKENHFKVKLPQVKVKNDGEVREEVVTTTLRRVIDYVSTIQAHDGHWPGDLPGPLFITPFLVISLYVTNTLNSVLSLEHMKEMRRYLYNTQNKDGGWGFNLQEHSSMLATGLSYIALRLLGEEANGGEDDSMEKGRNWILEHGGITMIPTWGKVLGVMEWSGVNPIPPEHVLIPSILPFHPGKLLRYFRLTYLPMAYLYGKRFVGPTTDTVLSLRKELLTHPYNKIDWSKARKLCAQEDLYYPHHWVQELIFDGLYNVGEPLLTRWPLSKLREKALRFIMEWIHYEDENSVYLNLGLTEKVLFFLACWVEDPNSDACKYHLARIPDYLWVAEDGMKMRVVNASEIFADTAIEYPYVECTSSAIQALLLFMEMYPKHRTKEIAVCVHKAINFIESIQEDDGSWYGNWGTCYTYGTWFAIEGLVAGGKTYSTSPSIRKACMFLLSKQLECGGWGESSISSKNKSYTNLEENRPNLVNTAWAMLALLRAEQAERDAASLHCAARLLINMQLENGEFPQQV